ncbi:MAG: hypothetical protein JWL77_2151 [Chthonomonadaceae bacterium]|nr:hypothetical protein [Chthonomonadaceae bacterium]
MRTHLFACNMAMLATVTSLAGTQLASDAIAQAVPPSGVRSLSASGRDYHANLAKHIEALAQRYQVRIVVDPEIEAPAAVPKSEKSASLGAALTGLTHQMKNAAWQRLFLKRDAVLPPPEKLAAGVRALSRLTQTELLVERPNKERGMLLLSLPRSRTLEAQAEIDLLDTKPVYLLYNTALLSDGKTALERIADSQRQQRTLLAQLPPAQRPNPVRLAMQVMQNMAGAGGEEALRATSEAGMAAWQNTAPDARDAMIKQFIKSVQNGPPLESDPAANPDPGGTAPQNHLDTLRDIATMLAKRYDVRILIDPALFVSAPPRRPFEEMTPTQALDLLAQSLPDSAWRGIYQKPPTAAPPALSARSLAATMRLLDHMPPALLHLENAASQRSVTLQSDLAATELPTKVTAHGFAARPTYLLYATQDATDRSLSVAQRLEQLQRQQMEQLLNLNSSQMNQVMIDALAQYSGGTAETSDQMMHLPIMALLMGIWFPQKAKER